MTDDHLLTQLSVVVPAYNEERTISSAIARVLAQPCVGEVVIVNDASTDNTGLLLDTIQDPRVIVISHERNRGKGAALRTGFAHATLPYVAVHDADLEYDPADFPRLLRPLVEGTADVVYGSRFVSGEARRVLYYWHSVGNRILTTFSNMLTNINLSDMETCSKVFRREIIQSIDLREERFGFEPEVTCKVAKLGCRIFEVGISYSGRTYAEGNKIGWKDGVRAMYVLVKYSRRSVSSPAT
ncbi:MAG: glycosyltransferase family 2 protein [Candidatus Nanopelagicales bacterium]|nr:glycosyltransferase family 2 protein [Candidatus Nanopelagicales bacterium]